MSDGGPYDAMPHECAKVLADLHRLLDEECPPGEARDLRVHLRGCEPCLRRADFERALREILATACNTRAPRALQERIVVHVRTTICD